MRGLAMLTKVVLENWMVRIRRMLSVWWIALAVGWAAAVAGPAEDLINTASRGEAAAGQALLSKGADVHAKGRKGGTAPVGAPADRRRGVVGQGVGAGRHGQTQKDNGATPSLGARGTRSV